MFQIIMDKPSRKFRNRDSGKKDILIIAAIGIVIVAAFIFFTLRILSHSEKHVETIKKTKFNYNESLSWRADSKISDSRIQADYANNLTQSRADYGDLDISEKSFKLIGKMPKLTTLKLTRATFDESWLPYLKKLPLRYLGLHGTPVSDKCIPTILEMKRLRNLDIGDTELTDSGLELLCDSKKLRHLELNLPRRITNDGVKHIAKMKKLEQLELSDPKNIDGKCLVHLAGLKNIFYLNIESMSVKPEDLSNLESLEKLSFLDISNCNLTDEEIAEIAKLKSITVLVVNGSSFSDKGLMKLKNLKSLERLNMKHCPNITEEGVNKFKAEMPRCQISYSRISSLNEKLGREDVKMELDFLKNQAKNEMKKLR